jgi:hypothetical protein
MADKIQIKRSSVEGKKPTPEQLADGELALNLKDKKIYAKDSDGVVQEFPAVDAVNVGVESVNDITGEVDINGSDNISVTKSGQNLTLDVKDTVALKTDVPAQLNLIEGTGIDIASDGSNRTITNEITDLGDLDSVVIDDNTGIAENSVLTFTDGNWVPGTGGGSSDVENLPDLGDVTISPNPPTQGQVLQYTDGKWQNVDVDAAEGRTTVNTLGGAVTIKGTSPISVASPNPNNDNEIVIGYSGTQGIEEAPDNGKQYARKNKDWSEVQATGGGKETLSELTDTNISSIEDEQFLRWDGDDSTGKWKNETVTLAPSNAQQNVKSDWEEETETADAFILNKPTKLSDFTDDLGYTDTDTGIVKLTHGETSVTGGTDREVTFKSSDASVQFVLNSNNEIDFTVPLAGLNIKGVVQYAEPQTQADGKITVNGTEYEVLWDPATYLNEAQSEVAGAALGDLWIVQYQGDANDEGTEADGNGYVYSLDENGVAEWSLVGPIQGPPGEDGVANLPISSTDNKVTLSDDDGTFQIETGDPTTDPSSKAVRVEVDSIGHVAINGKDSVSALPRTNTMLEVVSDATSPFSLILDAQKAIGVYEGRSGIRQYGTGGASGIFEYAIDNTKGTYMFGGGSSGRSVILNGDSVADILVKPNEYVRLTPQVRSPQYTTEDAAVNDCMFRAAGRTFEVWTGNAGDDNTKEKSLVGTHGNWSVGLPKSGNMQPTSSTTLNVYEDYKTASGNYLGLNATLNLPAAVTGWCYGVKSSIESMSDDIDAVYNFVGSRPVRDLDMRTVTNGNDVQVPTYSCFMVWSAINSRSKHNSAFKSAFNQQTLPAVGFFGEYETVQVPNPDYIDAETTPGIPPTIDQVNEIQPPDVNFPATQRVVVQGEIASPDDLPDIIYNTESIVDGETVIVPPPPGSPQNGDAYTLNAGDQIGRVYCLTGFDPAVADSGEWTIGVVPEFTYDNWNIDVQGNAPSRFYGNVCTPQVGNYNNRDDQSSIRFSGGQMVFRQENHSYFKCTEDSTTNGLYFYDAIDQNTWNGAFITYTSVGDVEPRTTFDLGKNSALVWASRGNLGVCSASGEVRIGVSTTKNADQQLTVNKDFVKSSVQIQTDTITTQAAANSDAVTNYSSNNILNEVSSFRLQARPAAVDPNVPSSGQYFFQMDSPNKPGTYAFRIYQYPDTMNSPLGSQTFMYTNVGYKGTDGNWVSGKSFGVHAGAELSLNGFVDGACYGMLFEDNGIDGSDPDNYVPTNLNPQVLMRPQTASGRGVTYEEYTPTEDLSVATKKYVDNKAGSGKLPISSADDKVTLSDDDGKFQIETGDPTADPSTKEVRVTVDDTDIKAATTYAPQTNESLVTVKYLSQYIDNLTPNPEYPTPPGGSGSGLTWEQITNDKSLWVSAVYPCKKTGRFSIIGYKNMNGSSVAENIGTSNVYGTASLDLVCYHSLDGRNWTEGFVGGNWKYYYSQTPSSGAGTAYMPTFANAYGRFCDGPEQIFAGNAYTTTGTSWQGFNLNGPASVSSSDNYVGTYVSVYYDASIETFSKTLTSSNGTEWAFTSNETGWPDGPAWITSRQKVISDLASGIGESIGLSCQAWATVTDANESGYNTNPNNDSTPSQPVLCISPKVYYDDKLPPTTNSSYDRYYFRPLQDFSTFTPSRSRNWTQDFARFDWQVKDAAAHPDGKRLLLIDADDNQLLWAVAGRTTLTTPPESFGENALLVSYDEVLERFVAVFSDYVLFLRPPASLADSYTNPQYPVSPNVVDQSGEYRGPPSYTQGDNLYGQKNGTPRFLLPKQGAWTQLSITETTDLETGETGSIYLLMDETGGTLRYDTTKETRIDSYFPYSATGGTWEDLGVQSPSIFSKDPMVAGVNGRFLVGGGSDVDGVDKWANGQQGAGADIPIIQFPTGGVQFPDECEEDYRYSYSEGDVPAITGTTTDDVGLTDPVDTGGDKRSARKLLTTQKDANEYFAEEIEKRAIVVTLTQAEYDALSPPDENTLYLIT